ncbi:hypothetical protein HALO32_03227 [Halomonas lysinitropha]|uniref:Uncharacterized protein n=1 Tax=Halomonas lysinitropha TaxID=2607506 RepID=A0A5K1I972_9GAMM|nr:hypothetical protein [Halomonas lysinitropha]VVZ97111.1 hypothetical protein HALO32_03227 [Halomonas lysinitropha]
MNTPRLKERLVALIVLAALLFTPPLLLIAEGASAGPGWLVVYLFLAWGAVIALMAWLMERRHKE